MDPYIGTIMLWPGTYEPEGWVFCDGRRLNIQPFVVLYSLIGTTYGGDDRTYFQVPDLRGRVLFGTNQTTYGNVEEGTGGSMRPPPSCVPEDSDVLDAVSACDGSDASVADDGQPYLALNYIIAVTGLYPPRQ